MRFATFLLHVSKVLRLPGKSEAGSYEVLHLSRKIIFAKLKISCSKMPPFSGNLRPDLLTHLTHVSLVLRLPHDMHLSRSSSNVPRLPSFKKLLTLLHLSLFSSFAWSYGSCFRLSAKGSQGPVTFWWRSAAPPSQPWSWSLHSILRLGCWPVSPVMCGVTAPLLGNKGVLTTSLLWGAGWRPIPTTTTTSKSGPNMVCLVLFSAFWLGNVLLATTACTFSTSQLPKSGPSMVCFVHFCASRHNGVHFFNISTSKSGPTLVCLVHFWLGHVLRATTACNFSSLIWPHGSAPATLASLLCDPSEPQIIGKT